MKARLIAVLDLAAAVLLYPTALALLIWIGWTGRSALWGIGVIIVVLAVDRTWWVILRGLFGPKR